jgi:putative mRNA 3-end processing factor
LAFDFPFASENPLVILSNTDLIIQRPEGLYCPVGDFYIDPWRAVPRAVITHAHADHARRGHGAYLATAVGAGVLRARLGSINLQGVAYGEAVLHNGVRISLHPAGHVLGSAQVRVEHGGQVWVASGDYFVAGDGRSAAADGQGTDTHTATDSETETETNTETETETETETNSTCAPFEPVRCHCFITESTFGLPLYRWPSQQAVFGQINAWWQANAQLGRTSVLLGYSFGKAQRLLAGVDEGIGPIAVHPAVQALNEAYRAEGVRLPATRRVDELAALGAASTGPNAFDWGRALIVTPNVNPDAPWARCLREPSTAFASGWMQLRSARRSRVHQGRGFVLSDHADWPGLQRAIRATGAPRVIVTHGFEQPMVRWLNEQGLQAGSVRTEYGGGEDDSESPDTTVLADPGREASLRLPAERSS